MQNTGQPCDAASFLSSYTSIMPKFRPVKNQTVLAIPSPCLFNLKMITRQLENAERIESIVYDKTHPVTAVPGYQKVSVGLP